jgi:hypothetical protein
MDILPNKRLERTEGTAATNIGQLYLGRDPWIMNRIDVSSGLPRAYVDNFAQPGFGVENDLWVGNPRHGHW